MAEPLAFKTPEKTKKRLGEAPDLGLAPKKKWATKKLDDLAGAISLFSLELHSAHPQ